MGDTAAVAYKIGKKNTQQVEQYTGKSFDSLNEDELATAMDDLSIDLPEEEEGQTVTESYDNTPNYIDELERLAALKEQGIVSEAEFEAKKKQLLGL